MKNTYDMTFTFKDESGQEKLWVCCWCSGGRVGFQHRANVYVNESPHRYKDKFFKVQYYNRTWERFRYQSLLRHVLSSLLKDKVITDEEYQKFKKEIE